LRLRFNQKVGVISEFTVPHCSIDTVINLSKVQKEVRHPPVFGWLFVSDDRGALFCELQAQARRKQGNLSPSITEAQPAPPVAMY